MTVQHHPDELARLRAELAAQRVEVAALRARIDRPRRRFPRRFLPLALVTLLVALMPLSILAADPIFSDLGLAAPVHRTNIQAIANVGITTGFEDPADPTTRIYDPKGLVTREELASFLARTAGLGVNPPVTNAKTAQTATNATTVGGFAPSGLTRVAHAIGANRAGTATANTLPVTGIYDAATPALSTYNDLVSIQLAAPGAGYVLVTGAVSFTLAPNSNNVGVIRLRDPLGDLASPIAFSAANGDGVRGVVPVTFVFPVAAGNRPFVLQVARLGTATAAEAFNGTLTALFVPFGPTGNTP